MVEQALGPRRAAAGEAAAPAEEVGLEVAAVEQASGPRRAAAAAEAALAEEVGPAAVAGQASSPQRAAGEGLAAALAEEVELVAAAEEVRRFLFWRFGIPSLGRPRRRWPARPKWNCPFPTPPTGRW